MLPPQATRRATGRHLFRRGRPGSAATATCAPSDQSITIRPRPYPHVSPHSNPEVNDDSSCRGGHSSSYITITAYGSYTVPSFQTRVNLGGVRVSGTIGQIDGKVSCVRLTRFA